jgi:hypothetical protein
MPTIRKNEEQYIKEVLDRVREKTVYDGDCWRYTGKHVGKGYASITYRNTTIRLNRFIGYVYYGLELSGNLTYKQACHKPECRFRDCWNPDHIYVGLPKDNVADQIKAGTFHYGTDNLFDNSRRGPRKNADNG